MNLSYLWESWPHVLPVDFVELADQDHVRRLMCLAEAGLTPDETRAFLDLTAYNSEETLPC